MGTLEKRLSYKTVLHAMNEKWKQCTEAVKKYIYICEQHRFKENIIKSNLYFGFCNDINLYLLAVFM